MRNVPPYLFPYEYQDCEPIPGDGPWKNEANAYTGFYKDIPWAIIRVPNIGHLSGYVVVPTECHWRDVKDLDVHGGITYGPQKDEEDNTWIGFDCAHPDDICPLMPIKQHGTYKTKDYVLSQIHSFIDQLISLKVPPMHHVRDYSTLITQARAIFESEETLSGNINISLSVSFRNHSGDAEIHWNVSIGYATSIKGPDLLELCYIALRRWQEDHNRAPLMLPRVADAPKVSSNDDDLPF
jgi:hypothetical protein